MNPITRIASFALLSLLLPLSASPPASAQTSAASSGPYWACAASGDGTQYDSAIFSGANLSPQQIFSEYRGYLSKKYGIGSMPNCESQPAGCRIS